MQTQSLIYHNHKRRQLALMLLGITALLLFGMYASLRFGAIEFSHQTLVTTLTNRQHSDAAYSVIFDLRLPRLLAAILVGAALSCAGLIMQAVMRNPIAEPSLLGINAGAGLALVIAYALFGTLHYKSVIWVAFLGASITCGLVLALSYSPQRGYQPMRLILAGAMIATLFGAIGQAITLYFNLANSVMGWQAGGLVGVNWSMLSTAYPIILCALLIAQCAAHQLSILSLDSTVAQALGQRTILITLILLSVVLLLTAVAIALAGTLAFVGLIIPHSVKKPLNARYAVLLPMTALAGATFMVWVDIISRSIRAPYETPINGIIALVGLPCFLWLLRRSR